MKQGRGFTEFMNDVQDEYSRAVRKHPVWPKDKVHASAILNEEAGKLTQVCINNHYQFKDKILTAQDMATYAARVAAMAFRFYQGLYNS